jgi:hypothetical protein
VNDQTYYWSGGRKIRLDRVADPPGPLAGDEPDDGPPAPVYRAEDGSLVAVLPEVRVECADPEVLDRVAASLEAATVERSEERLVIRPDSGRGEDALAIANHLHDAYGVDVAQARFRRVVPRPGVDPPAPG